MFVCSKCSQEFRKRFACERHEKSIHGIEKSVKTGPFVCSVCTKSFLYKRSLKFHVKSHGDTERRSAAVESEPPPNPVNKATVLHGKSFEDFPELKGHLPEGYDYTIEKYEKLDNGFIARILFPVPTVDTAKKFYSEYLTKSKQRYRTAKTERNPSKNIILRKSYHCHHDTQKKGHKNRKNTDCPARLYISVKSSKENFTCAVTCKISHNHSSDNAAALKVLLPSEEVVEKFRKMFEAGFSPSKALKQHEQDLLLEYGDEFYIAAADRTILPESSWVYHYYYKIFEENYGESHGDGMLKALSEAVENINKNGTPSAKINVHADSTFTLAVMTPLMRRVCETPLAGDISFIDSTGNVDRLGCRAFLMISPSCVGGLPHGAVLTTSESEEIITEGLQCYASLLTEKSFGGRGKKGPAIIMTDDSDAERNSLRTLFPCAILLLCIFHVLQAVWRWLLDSSNQIAACHRPVLFQKMKNLLYSKTEEDLNLSIEKFRSDPLLKQYPKFANYLERWINSKEAWAICLRKNEKLRGQHTNNLNEAANRILKEKVLDRLKAFSPVQLLDFLFKDFNSFYERKILKAAAGRPDAYLIRKETKVKFNIEDYRVEVIINDLIYEIGNLKNGNQYLYNLELNCCTCPVGDCGSICKHYRVLKKLVKIKKHELDLPRNEEEKNILHYIATGSVCQKKDWYGELVPSKSKEEVDEIDNTDNVDNSDNVDNINITNGDPGIDISLESSQSTNEKPNSSDDANRKQKTEILEKFKHSLQSIITKVENDPDTFFNAASAFVKSYGKIKTDASLISALHCFGKFNGLKGKLRNSSRIGVQSTAISRRKTPCGGRGNLQSGRPPKWAQAPEHSYFNDKKNKDRNMPQFKKNRKAPHNLNICVEENKAVGKKH